jgi:predicted nucleic acid binding AN1-type Zn finger protein
MVKCFEKICLRYDIDEMDVPKTKNYSKKLSKELHEHLYLEIGTIINYNRESIPHF